MLERPGLHRSNATTDSLDGLEHAVDFAFCLPMILVMNFTFAAHFLNLYCSSSRLHEMRVQCLVLTTWVSFVCLVGFAYLSPKALLALNDMSESAVVLTFVIQVTIITRDATNLCNLVSLRYFMRAADVLSALAVPVAVLDIVSLAMQEDETLFDATRSVNEWFENSALVFVVSFRFYYILLSRGSLRAVILNQPGGTLLYALLMVHEYPFMIARQFTSARLEYSNGVLMRALLLLCIWYTTRERQAAHRRRRGIRATRLTTRNRQLSSIVPCSPSTLHHSQPVHGHHASPLMHMRKAYQVQTAVVVPTQSVTAAMSSMVAPSSRRSEQRRGSHQAIGPT